MASPWQVEANLDDAYEKNDGTGFTTASSVVLSAGAADSVRYNGGFRFTDVDIPKDSVIDSASLEVYVLNVIVDDAFVDIYANAVDDAANFSDEPDVTSRATTSASAAWVETSTGAGWQQSRDIKEVIQEIVNREGWVSGQAIVILSKAQYNASTKNFVVQGHDVAPANAAKLNVTWTPPTAGGRRDAVLLGAGRGIARGAR